MVDNCFVGYLCYIVSFILILDGFNVIIGEECLVGFYCLVGILVFLKCEFGLVIIEKRVKFKVEC